MRKILLLLTFVSPPALAQDVTTSSIGPTLPTSTVAALPTCNAAAIGKMYMVTDASSPVELSNVAGGGAAKVSVVCNGTNWIVG